VRLQYLHANGQTYTQDVTVAAGRRATVYPGSVPAGAFGCHVTVLSGPPVAAERLLYGGPNWTISHAGVGSVATGTAWDFTEGVNSWPASFTNAARSFMTRRRHDDGSCRRFRHRASRGAQDVARASPERRPVKRA
jgi:hypothetical protein